MPDRIRELLAAIAKLQQRSRKLLDEHRVLIRETKELRQELKAIVDDAAARPKDKP